MTLLSPNSACGRAGLIALDDCLKQGVTDGALDGQGEGFNGSAGMLLEGNFCWGLGFRLPGFGLCFFIVSLFHMSHCFILDAPEKNK